MKSKTFSAIVSAFLSVFFIAILLLVLIGVFNLDEQKAFAAAAVFGCINMAVFAFVIGMGKVVADAVGVGAYASICVTTVVYTAAQLLWLGFNYTTEEILKYVIAQMVILFVYCLIVLPIAAVGVKHKEETTETVTVDDKGIRYHSR